MKVKLLRQFEEVIKVETKKPGELAQEVVVPVASMQEIGSVEYAQADIIACELSRKQTGIFWVSLDIEYEDEDSDDSRIMFVWGSRERTRPKGLPKYPVFSAGYLNGVKAFPKIAKEVRPSIVE